MLSKEISFTDCWKDWASRVPYNEALYDGFIGRYGTNISRWVCDPGSQNYVVIQYADFSSWYVEKYRDDYDRDQRSAVAQLEGIRSYNRFLDNRHNGSLDDVEE